MHKNKLETQAFLRPHIVHVPLTGVGNLFQQKRHSASSSSI